MDGEDGNRCRWDVQSRLVQHPEDSEYRSCGRRSLHSYRNFVYCVDSFCSNIRM
jgi:hypothetical protein